MKIYLVGGAVRDWMLGREVKDRDFVVVGATEQDMLSKGFKKVGADFPVFLHPRSGEEYALARKERKTGAGYYGFEVQFDPSVTLEDDLIRRDLTMNAMAVPVVELDDNGVPTVDFDRVIDPFGGANDILNGTLRHVSAAFAEDPVRVLRVARFAARYGFILAIETIQLMSELVRSGELDHLVPERVWAEMERAIMEKNPMEFFTTLWKCRADKKLLPELTFDERMKLNLERVADLDVRARFALLTLDLARNQIETFYDRLKAPIEFKRLALRAATMSTALRNSVTGESAIALLESVGAFQDATDAAVALDVCKTSVDNLGASFARRQQRIAGVLPLVTSVRFSDLTSDQQRSLKGPAIGKALRELRVNTATQFIWRQGLGH